MRSIQFERGFTCHAEGSVLVSVGRTKVLCTASVSPTVPKFLNEKNEGWVTAEYGLLPRSTGTRTDREAARGKQSGRTQEIQRLIGRSLRGIVDRTKLGRHTITLDCDVLQADGGTRCASITGAYVALVDAVNFMVEKGMIEEIPCSSVIIAISQGAQNRIVSTTTGLEMSSHGLLATDEHGHTTREGIFASGDVVLGARTVVEAVKYSKQVAEEMDEYLMKRREK